MDDLPELPGYRVTDRIGAGGMATVYRAVQLGLDRPVALKILSPGLARNADFGRRFLREARIVGQLSHAHIVPVFDVGEKDGHYYLSMEWLSHGDLNDAMRGGLDEDDTVRILTQVTQALRYAHARGFIHRDIKPDNILFRDAGNAVVTDFGIARQLRPDTDVTEITAVQSVIGSPRYMSPEQMRGETLDARSDLYSVGVVAWLLLTGRPPHDGNTLTEIAIARHDDPVPTLPDHLGRWQPLCSGLLAYASADRFADCDAVLAELGRLGTAGGDTAPATGPDRTAVYRPGEQAAVGGHTAIYTGGGNATAALARSKAPAWIGLGAVALLAAAGLGYWLIDPGSPPGAGGDVEPRNGMASQGATVRTPIVADPPAGDEPDVAETMPPPAPRVEAGLGDHAPDPAAAGGAPAAAGPADPGPALPAGGGASNPTDPGPTDPGPTDPGPTDPAPVAASAGDAASPDAAAVTAARPTVTTPTPDAYFAFRDSIATGNPQDARRFIEAYPQGILAEIVRVHLLDDGARLPQLIADADRGDVAAQLVLSELHSTGWGVEKHIDRAIAYAEDAARDGQAFARYQLAALLLGQVPDDAPAGTRVAQQLERAANAGVFLAQTLLGNLLFTGRLDGGPAVDRAIERFAQAAAQGDRNALFNLGLIYDGGLGGVTPDSARAQGYFRQAAALGHRNALNYLP
jgi:hypothetical protein